MNTFKRGDRVIVANPRGGDIVGTIDSDEKTVGMLKMHTVKFDTDYRTVDLPVAMLRHKGSSASIAKGIVDKLQEIEKLRNQVDRAFGDLIGLLALDGQPDYEQRRFEDMSITHRMVLKRDLAAELTAWEGYYEARKKR